MRGNATPGPPTGVAPAFACDDAAVEPAADRPSSFAWDVTCGGGGGDHVLTVSR